MFRCTFSRYFTLYTGSFCHWNGRAEQGLANSLSLGDYVTRHAKPTFPLSRFRNCSFSFHCYTRKSLEFCLSSLRGYHWLTKRGQNDWQHQYYDAYSAQPKSQRVLIMNELILILDSFCKGCCYSACSGSVSKLAFRYVPPLREICGSRAFTAIACCINSDNDSCKRRVSRIK